MTYEPKKFTVIIKVDDVKFIKYRGVTNFKSLVRYLDANFVGWRYFNVFDKYQKKVSSYSSKRGWLN